MSQKLGTVSERALFSPRATLLLAAVGVIAFGGWLVLSALGGEFRSGHDGGAHALSISGTGYAGLVALVQANAQLAFVARDRGNVAQAALAVLTPDVDGWDADDLRDVLYDRTGQPSLLVLPKWDTVADPMHSGWVEVDGPNATAEVNRILAALPLRSRLNVSESGAAPGPLTMMPTGQKFPAPERLRVIAGDGLTPVISNALGQIVLGQVARDLYVLADPDLVANHALADPAGARVAAGIVASLAPPDGAVVFDVTLNVFASSYSLGQLVFHPPFLGLTLCLMVAALITGIAAIPSSSVGQLPPPPLVFGKRTLIDNAAALIRIGRREGPAVARYVDVIIDDAAARAHLPAESNRVQLVSQLERRRGGTPSLDELLRAAATVTTPAEALAIAQKLHLWRQDVTREYS